MPSPVSQSTQPAMALKARKSEVKLDSNNPAVDPKRVYTAQEKEELAQYNGMSRQFFEMLQYDPFGRVDSEK